MKNLIFLLFLFLSFFSSFSQIPTKLSTKDKVMKVFQKKFGNLTLVKQGKYFEVNIYQMENGNNLAIVRSSSQDLQIADDKARMIFMNFLVTNEESGLTKQTNIKGCFPDEKFYQENEKGYIMYQVYLLEEGKILLNDAPLDINLYLTKK